MTISQISNSSIVDKETNDNFHVRFQIATLPNDILLHTFRVIGNAYNCLSKMGENFTFENIAELSNFQVVNFREIYLFRKTVAKSFISLMLTCSRLYKIATSDGLLRDLISLCKKSIAVIAKPSGDSITTKKKHQPQCCLVQ